eukprot:1257766-Prymnesium_polylepis.1
MITSQVHVTLRQMPPFFRPPSRWRGGAVAWVTSTWAAWVTWSHGSRDRKGHVVARGTWSHGARGRTGHVIARGTWSHGA